MHRLFKQAQSLVAISALLFLVARLFLSYADQLSADALTAELAARLLRGFIQALALQFTMIGLGSSLRGIRDMKPGLVA